MSTKSAELERRRERLILQSGGQRERLAESCEHLARSLRWAQLITGAVQTLKTNPGAVLGFTALLASARSKYFRKLAEWASLGWTIFRTVRARRAKRRA